MSAAAFRQYRRLVLELLVARDLAGGELPDDEEAERADELDVHWREMSAEERSRMEDEVQRHALVLPANADAPERLPEGQHTPQRKQV
jgi:hypothetical protein